MSFCPDSWQLVQCSEESPAESDVEVPCPALSNLPIATQEAVILAAKEFLFNATNQRFGLCEITYRPCNPNCYEQSTYRGWSGIPRGGWGWGSWEPYIFNGNWFNMACGNCEGPCDSSHMSTIQLPGRPNSVVSVVLDGAPFTDWTFDNLGLHRTDGLKWPESQKQALPLTEPDTFGVTVLDGLPVPAGGQIAAGLLACEFAKATCSDGTCQLPRRVQTIVRQGVTVAFTDNWSMLANPGRSGVLSGLWSVDSWIASVNYAARNRSRVLTPDAKVTRRI